MRLTNVIFLQITTQILRTTIVSNYQFSAACHDSLQQKKTSST